MSKDMRSHDEMTENSSNNKFNYEDRDLNEPMLQHALNYAENGVKVFPANPDSKQPMCGAWKDTATSDPLAVQSLWSDKEAAMIATPTGQVNGFVVLDVDVGNDKEGAESLDQLCDEYGPLPATKVVRTQSGGFHYYFKSPADISIKNSASKIGKDLDIRGDGGYVIAPPSIGSKGTYTITNEPDLAEMPEWLITLTQAEIPSKQHSISSIYNDLEIQNGNRNSSLASVAGRLRHRGADESTISTALHTLNERLNDPLEVNEVEAVAGSISKYEATIDLLPAGIRCCKNEYACTDAGNAERFIELHFEELKFCPEINSWLRWNNSHWGPAGSITPEVIETVRSINIEAAICMKEHRRRELQKLARSAESGNKISTLETLLQKLPEIQINASHLDASPYLVGCPNGVIDLRNGELIPAERDQWITKQLGDVYDPDAEAPKWDKFLAQIMGGDQEMVQFLQVLHGSMLFAGNKEQKLAVMHGVGANGKGVLLNTLLPLFGDYAKQIDTSTFMAQKGNAGGARADLVRLQGVRMIVGSESSEGEHLDEALIKALTGGDPIVARALYSNKMLEYIPAFTPILVTNHKPIIKGTDYAIWRRLLLMPFDVVFKGEDRDPHLPEKLQDERAGILKWLIDGAVTYNREGLIIPHKVESATDDYQTDMDLIGRWTDDMCVVGPEFKCTVEELYFNYTLWAQHSGLHPVSKIMFGRKLSDRGYGTTVSNSIRFRTGISCDYYDVENIKGTHMISHVLGGLAR